MLNVRKRLGSETERIRSSLRRRRARNADYPVIVRDARGLAFEIENAEEMVAFWKHRGHFESASIDLLAAFFATQDRGTAIDVGASTGPFTAALARAAKPGCAVHAFEPYPPLRQRLLKNLALNDLKDVRVNPWAVTDVSGVATLNLFGPGRETWTSAVRDRIETGNEVLTPSESLVVDAVTLDDYCDSSGISHVSVLKVDVEGGEAAVIAGAGQLFARNAIDVVAIEVSDNSLPDGTTSAQLLDSLMEYGLMAYVLSEDDHRLRPFRPKGRVAFANVIALTQTTKPIIPALFD